MDDVEVAQGLVGHIDQFRIQFLDKWKEKEIYDRTGCSRLYSPNKLFIHAPKGKISNVVLFRCISNIRTLLFNFVRNLFAI